MMKKLITVLAILVMICGVSLPAEAATKEQMQAKKAVVSLLKYSKKYDTKKIKACFQSPKKVQLFESNVYMRKFMQRANKRTSWEIKSVKANKKSATVKVVCEYYDGYHLFQESFKTVLKHALENPSGDDWNKYQYAAAKKAYDKDKQPTYNRKTLTFNLKKIGTKWKITKFTNAYYNMVNCNYPDAYDTFDWEYWTWELYREL